MGITFLPWAMSQAKATCPAVALCRDAISFSVSTNLSTLGKFSLEKLRTRSVKPAYYVLLTLTGAGNGASLSRGSHQGFSITKLVFSHSGSDIALTYWPVKIPRPNGLYATTAIPSSCATLKRSVFCSSKSKGEYSIWRAEMGWTACARRRVSMEHSEIPIYLTLPDLRSNDQRSAHS